MAQQTRTPFLQGDLSLTFPVRDVFNVSEEKLYGDEVIQAVQATVAEDSIKAVQIKKRKDLCIITLKDIENKEALKSAGFFLRGEHIFPEEAQRDITLVTISDLPIEMNDLVICTAMEKYGKVLNGSMRRQYYRNFPNIQNGTRTVKLLDVKSTIPISIKVGRFNANISCNNRKTECRYCNSVDHPFFQCPNKDKQICFECGSTDHVKAKCPNKACHNCGGRDHRKADCPVPRHEDRLHGFDQWNDEQDMDEEHSCTFCGQSGHPSKSCPETPNNLQREDWNLNPGTFSKSSHTFPPYSSLKSKYDLSYLPDNTVTWWENKPIYDEQLRVKAFRGGSNCLSNHYIVKNGLLYKDEEYPSVEHAYKCAQAIICDREDLIDEIKKQPTGKVSFAEY